MKHDIEWRKNQSEGLKRAWAEGKFKDKKPLDYAAIAEKNRGKKRPEYARMATGIGVKNAWANGAYDKPETLKKRKAHLEYLRRNFNNGRSAEYMHKIRESRNLDKLRPVWRKLMKSNVEKWRHDGTMQKTADWNRRRLTGGNGQGKNKRGSLDHS